MLAMMMMPTGVAVELVAAVLLAVWIAFRCSRGEGRGEKHFADYDNHTQHVWLEKTPQRHVFLPCDGPVARGAEVINEGTATGPQSPTGTMTSLYPSAGGREQLRVSEGGLSSPDARAWAGRGITARRSARSHAKRPAPRGAMAFGGFCRCRWSRA